MKAKTAYNPDLVLKEIARRAKITKAIRDSLFKEQLAFIDDPSQLKTALCTRRAGKSYTIGADLVIEALNYPGCTSLYIAPTREVAKRIMFKDILKRLNRKFELGIRFNHTTLEVIFPNGSVVYLMGLDSTPEDMDKAYGQKYRRVYIDEGGAWRQDQEKLVHEILEPACADLEGTICIAGSPVSQTTSYFFKITSKPGNVKGWSCHSWTWKENPHIAEQMSKQIKRMIKNNPRIVETAPYKRMYLGLWVVDLGSLVYKFSEDRNKTKQLPPDGKFHFVLGLDLGFEDATAFVVAAYSEHDPILYFVHAYKESKLDISAVAVKLAAYRAKYNPVKWIVDGASKQAVAELNNRHGFTLEPADKVGKVDMIEIMNADFILARIRITPSAGILQEEWENLIWDHDSQKKQEHPGCENHAADAALYAWRYCYHYLSQEKEAPIKKGSNEEIEAWWDRQSRIGLRQLKEDPLIRDFGEQYGFKRN